VDLGGALQRDLDICADVVMADVLVELCLLDDGGGLVARAAQ
jgi:hypothetical protein